MRAFSLHYSSYEQNNSPVLLTALLKIGVKKIGTQGAKKAAQQTPDKSLLQGGMLAAFVLALSARSADF